MSLFFVIFFYFFIFFLSTTIVDLTLINFITSDINYTVLIWLIVSVISINLSSSSNKYSTVLLYIFGIYNSVIRNILPTLILMWKNLLISFNFIIYNINDFISFLPKSQTWVPLFKRGGYLFLLNSMRTRWQLSKSNSIFKNK